LKHLGQWTAVYRQIPRVLKKIPATIGKNSPHKIGIAPSAGHTSPELRSPSPNLRGGFLFPLLCQGRVPTPTTSSLPCVRGGCPKGGRGQSLLPYYTTPPLRKGRSGGVVETALGVPAEQEVGRGGRKLRSASSPSSARRAGEVS